MNQQERSLVDKWSLKIAQLWQKPILRQLMIVIPLVLLITYFYVFLASAGTFEVLGSRPDYYDRMAEGFRAGHLYILEQPKAALLAKADPFAQNNFFEDLWLWDASLYKGHYYLYWGPVPGLLMLAWKVLTGYTGVVSDQWPTVIYMTGRLVFGAGLILGLAKYMRVVPENWIVALAIAVFGLSGPIPFIVARPVIYEAALAAGQCFLYAGLLSCFLGITLQRQRSVLFVAASVLWGLAFGSRMTTIIAVPFIIVLTVYFVWYKLDRSVIHALKNALLLGLPVFAFVVAYGVYNYVRFDSPFEFGTRYQVTLQQFTTHRRFIAVNIYSYLFAPVKWTCSFPFVVGLTDRPPVKFIDWPPGYLTFEKVSGVLVMGGFCWLQFVPFGWGVRRCWRRLRSSTVPYYPSTPFVYYWAIGCSLGLILCLVPALGLWEASMRYSGDAIGGMVIAASVVAFVVIRRNADSGRTASKTRVRLLVLLLGLHSCFVGAFSGFSSYNEPFERYNPQLYRKLSEALSICPANTQTYPSATRGAH